MRIGVLSSAIVAEIEPIVTARPAARLGGLG